VLIAEYMLLLHMGFRHCLPVPAERGDASGEVTIVGDLPIMAICMKSHGMYSVDVCQRNVIVITGAQCLCILACMIRTCGVLRITYALLNHVFY
jgi:hypothetical protein